MAISRTDYAVPVFEWIKERVENNNVTPSGVVLDVLNGADFTLRVCLDLEKIIGVPAIHWSRRDALYRDYIKRVEATKRKDQMDEARRILGLPASRF